MIIVNGFQPLTVITKLSILDVAAALDPPLVMAHVSNKDPSGCFHFSLFFNSFCCTDKNVSFQYPFLYAKFIKVLIRKYYQENFYD